MNDLAIGVTLRADGSGFVGQVNNSVGALDKLTAASNRAGAAAASLGTATNDLTSGGRAAAFQLSDLAEKSQAQVAAQSRMSGAIQNTNKGLGAQRAAYQQLGFQLQDSIIQAQMGTSAFVIFAQQGAQAMGALSLLASSADGTKGKFASFATFLAGPWGAAVGVAIALAGALGTALLNNADAAKAAEIGSSGLADAQSVLGQIFDLTSGKIKSQNELLLMNARLTQLNLQAEAQAERARGQAALGRAANPSAWSNFMSGFIQQGTMGASEEQLRDLSGAQSKSVGALRDRLNNALKMQEGPARSKALDQIMQAVGGTDFSGTSITADQFRQAMMDMVSADAKDATADLMRQTLDKGVLAAEFRQEKPTRKNTVKKDRTAEQAVREQRQYDDFSDRSLESLARLDDQFNDAPKDVDNVRKAMAQVDAIIKDVNQKLTDGKHITAEQHERFDEIAATAQRLKPLIEESLVRPFKDLLSDQSSQIALGQAMLTGRESEVQALQLTQRLMQMVGAESEAQLATELAKRGVTEDQVTRMYDNLEVMRQQSRELEKQRAEQENYLTALGNVDATIRSTLANLRTQGPKAVADMFKDLLVTADNLFADVLTEQLFGDLFRDLRDQMTGADKVSKAGDRIAKSVNEASDDLDSFASALETAAVKIIAAADAAANGTALAGATGNDIVVNGRRPDVALKSALKDSFREGYEGVFKEFKTGMKGVFTEVFGDGGLFGSALGKNLPGALGAGIANAQIGAIVGKGVTDGLGLKGSTSGGSIGGIIGGAVAGPVGAAVGSVLGSLTGGLFKKTPYGTAAITGQGEDDISVRGNKSAAKANASSAAGAVQDGLAQIAEAFGGTVGSYNVSIGQYKDMWRVNTEGYQGTLKGKGQAAIGLHNFDDDSAGAIAFAIAAAVADDAIEGVSDKVAKALKSTTDIDEAIAEAQKVREVETLLGGLGEELASQFRTLEATAKERLRIAREYGFDVVEIEKKNAEDRAKLVDQILADRVGSLQSLLNDMKYGSLFEGSAMDQREALLLEIAKAQEKALAGEDGAADTLASLQRQLVELSRDAFGTAGSEYAADRAGAASSAQLVIDAENARIKAAQDATLATNQKLDTANDLAGQAVDQLVENNKLLAQIAAAVAANGGSLVGVDLSAVAR